MRSHMHFRLGVWKGDLFREIAVTENILARRHFRSEVMQMQTNRTVFYNVTAQ